MVGEERAAPPLSFETFFAAQYPRLVRNLLALTGSRAVAEELAQEALLEAHRRWATVERLDRADLWVRRVAVNRAISRHRRLLAEAAALLRLGRVNEWQEDSCGDDELWAAVRRLPRRQAVALILSSEGHTAREVATVLDCSEETARTHLRRARATLARTLEVQDDDDAG